MEEHNARVSQIALRIKELHKSSIPFRIYHGSTNSTRPSSRTHTNTVDISDLNNIVTINGTTKTCLAEPNVPMDRLVNATLKYGLVPPVIPEFPGITVGGAFAGTAGESSSFRHGFFDECVNRTEMVLANGDVVLASEEENVDLFHGSKGTFGTLGVGTLFEVRLIEAKKYVELKYEVVSNGAEEAKSIMERECKKTEEEVQFVDGILYSKDTGVIVVGHMTDGLATEVDKRQTLPVVTFTNPSDPWYYLHARDVMNNCLVSKGGAGKSDVYRELVPLQDYLFRYDRGGFWTGYYAFKYFITPFNQITRRLLNNFMHTRTMYHALHRSGLMERCLIQDMAVPWHNIEPFLGWLDKELDVYPLWIAPLKVGKGGIHFNPKFSDTASASSAEPEIILNVGVWRMYYQNTLKINRDLEAKLIELKGQKWLYSQTFYTEDEFWSIYHREWYEKLRSKYHATTLPNVYDKVGGTALNRHNALTGIWSVWPLAGLYGVLSTLKGGDYLRKSQT